MGEAGDLSGEGRGSAGDPTDAGDSGGGEGESQRAGPAAARLEPRHPAEGVVRLHCEGRRGIHTGFLRDLSRGGIFLHLVDPEPVGARMHFELHLPGCRAAVRGVAEVAWQRQAYAGPGRPPGMALRFVALESRGAILLGDLLPEGEPDVPLLPVEAAPLIGGARLVALATREEEAAATAELEAPAAAPGETDPRAPEAPAVDPVARAPRPLEIPPSSEDAEPLPPRQAPVAAVAPVLAAATTAEVSPRPSGRPPSGVPLRWRNTAAGIAAVAGLASLVIVGAARFGQAGSDGRGEAVQAPAARPVTAGGVAAPARSPVAPPRGDGSPHGAAAANAVPATATATTAPEQARSVAPARRVTALRWEPLPGGGTQLTVSLDGALDPQRVRASSISGDSPRLLVRLLGVGEEPAGAPWRPQTAEVERIRAGLHGASGASELHLVIDLASPRVRLSRTRVTGSELALDLVAATP